MISVNLCDAVEMHYCCITTSS